MAAIGFKLALPAAVAAMGLVVCASAQEEVPMPDLYAGADAFDDGYQEISERWVEATSQIDWSNARQIGENLPLISDLLEGEFFLTGIRTTSVETVEIRVKYSPGNEFVVSTFKSEREGPLGDKWEYIDPATGEVLATSSMMAPSSDGPKPAYNIVTIRIPLDGTVVDEIQTWVDWDSTMPYTCFKNSLPPAKQATEKVAVLDASHQILTIANGDNTVLFRHGVVFDVDGEAAFFDNFAVTSFSRNSGDFVEFMDDAQFRNGIAYRPKKQQRPPQAPEYCVDIQASLSDQHGNILFEGTLQEVEAFDADAHAAKLQFGDGADCRSLASIHAFLSHMVVYDSHAEFVSGDFCKPGTGRGSAGSLFNTNELFCTPMFMIFDKLPAAYAEIIMDNFERNHVGTDKALACVLAPQDQSKCVARKPTTPAPTTKAPTTAPPMCTVDVWLCTEPSPDHDSTSDLGTSFTSDDPCKFVPMSVPCSSIKYCTVEAWECRETAPGQTGEKSGPVAGFGGETDPCFTVKHTLPCVSIPMCTVEVKVEQELPADPNPNSKILPSWSTGTDATRTVWMNVTVPCASIPPSAAKMHAAQPELMHMAMSSGKAKLQASTAAETDSEPHLQHAGSPELQGVKTDWYTADRMFRDFHTKIIIGTRLTAADVWKKTCGERWLIFSGTETDGDDAFNDANTGTMGGSLFTPPIPGNWHTGFGFEASRWQKWVKAWALGTHYFPGVQDKIVFAGHSLGGAMASMLATWWKIQNPTHAVEIVTFGAPAAYVSGERGVYVRIPQRRYVNRKRTCKFGMVEADPVPFANDMGGGTHTVPEISSVMRRKWEWFDCKLDYWSSAFLSAHSMLGFGLHSAYSDGSDYTTNSHPWTRGLW